MIVHGERPGRNIVEAPQLKESSDERSPREKMANRVPMGRWITCQTKRYHDETITTKCCTSDIMLQTRHRRGDPQEAHVYVLTVRREQTHNSRLNPARPGAGTGTTEQKRHAYGSGLIPFKRDTSAFHFCFRSNSRRSGQAEAIHPTISPKQGHASSEVPSRPGTLPPDCCPARPTFKSCTICSAHNLAHLRYCPLMPQKHIIAMPTNCNLNRASLDPIGDDRFRMSTAKRSGSATHENETQQTGPAAHPPENKFMLW